MHIFSHFVTSVIFKDKRAVVHYRASVRNSWLIMQQFHEVAGEGDFALLVLSQATFHKIKFILQ